MNLLFHLLLRFGSVSDIPGLVPGLLVPDVTLTWCKLVRAFRSSLCAAAKPASNTSCAPRPERAAQVGT
eukprot:1145121-Pelagomonas_calceolata.AAC.1